MSQCPDCGCDLPSFQTLCSKCYDAKSAEVGRSKSILESIWQSRSTPRRWQVIEDRINAQPWWLAWCFAVIGLGSVSYTHLRAHETPEHLVCRLLLEKKKKK